MRYFIYGLFLGLLWAVPCKAKILIYAPPTPSSIPLILAAENIPETRVKIFTSHSRAHALFLNGEADMLCTGLSVGVQFFKQNIPVQMVNSYVSGLTWMVSHENIINFKQLHGKSLCLPFAGSPIEEVSKFFAAKDGEKWKQDISIKYAPFPAAVKMLKNGKIFAAALPEPFVSMIQQPDIYIGPSYESLWQKHTGQTNGYPQISVFIKKKWAYVDSHKNFIDQLNKELEKSLLFIKKNPQKAVQQTKKYFQFPEKILVQALSRTHFYFLKDAPLKQAVRYYYETLGSPLNETFKGFFYTSQK